MSKTTIDQSIAYGDGVMTQRDYKRQIQVPNQTKQVVIDLAIGADKLFPSDLAVTGQTIYDCVANLKANAIVNATSLVLEHVRGILSIPNIVTGRNNVLTVIVDGAPFTITFPQGFYTLSQFAGTLATLLSAATGLGVMATGIVAATGSFVIDVSLGHTIMVPLASTGMAAYPRFCPFPAVPAARLLSVNGCWLFYTRYVALQCSDITQMLAPSCVGNMPRFSGAMTLLKIENPTAPQFFQIDYSDLSHVIPLRYDNRIEQVRCQMFDEYGTNLAAYVSAPGDFLTMFFYQIK